eukprot:COSAG02_NODE_3615_length_6474_cov_4.439059_2_plen_70_part_01
MGQLVSALRRVPTEHTKMDRVHLLAEHTAACQHLILANQSLDSLAGGVVHFGGVVWPVSRGEAGRAAVA